MSTSSSCSLATRRLLRLVPPPVREPREPNVLYATTGPEIWAQVGGKVFFAGIMIGTGGGTLTGVGRFLKERSPAAVGVGFEPSEKETRRDSKRLEETRRDSNSWCQEVPDTVTPAGRYSPATKSDRDSDDESSSSQTENKMARLLPANIMI